MKPMIIHLDDGEQGVYSGYITLCHRKVAIVRTYTLKSYLSQGYETPFGYRMCKQCLNKISDLDYINNTKL